MQLLEGETLKGIGIGGDFLGENPKAQVRKANQTNSILSTLKASAHQKIKSAEWRNIEENGRKYLQASYLTNDMKYVSNSKNSIKMWSSQSIIKQNIWIDSCEKDGQQIHEKKMLNISRNQQIPIQNHNETSPVIRIIFAQKWNNKCQWECGERRTLVCCWQEWKLVQPLRKTVWQLPEKVEIELLCDPAIPLLDVHPENMKSFYERDVCIAMFTTLFRVAQNKKSTSMFIIK